MVSQGHACERCKGGAFWHALFSNCYPGTGARIALTAEAYAHRWIKTYPFRWYSTGTHSARSSHKIEGVRWW
jgi:hypothetical protein